MIGFVMNKDSAIRICNSVYSIMLGFTVNNMLLINKDWANYSMTLTCMAAIIMVYYIIDWFSFNALATIDKTQESVEIFLAIVFVIYLGWLMVFANNLGANNIYSFLLYASIYLLISTILFIVRLYITMKEKWQVDLEKDKFVLIDMCIRIILGIIGLVCSANKINQTAEYFSSYTTFLSIGAIIVLAIKVIRYLDLVKLIKEKENSTISQ